MDDIEIKDLLESRHTTLLQWEEPWPACGPEGNELNAHVILQATVHDCINLSRWSTQSAGVSLMLNDREHLLNFIAIHWAYVVPRKD